MGGVFIVGINISFVTFRTSDGMINVLPDAVISVQRISGGTLLKMDDGGSVSVIEPFDSVIMKIEDATE